MPMKPLANLLPWFFLISAQICHSAEIESIAIAQLLAFYDRHAVSPWEHVQNAPAHIVESAELEYDSYIDSMKEIDSAAVFNKIEEESTADFYDIIVIYNKQLEFYKVARMYLWENLDCGGYYFHADTFTFTESGGRVNDGVVPSMRTGRAVCTH